MAVMFHCVLICDACGLSQSARAKLVPITLTSVLEPGSSDPFILEFDPLTGKSWTVFPTAAVCSSDCKAKLLGSP